MEMTFLFFSAVKLLTAEQTVFKQVLAPLFSEGNVYTLSLSHRHATDFITSSYLYNHPHATFVQMLDGPAESTFQLLFLFMQMLHAVNLDSLDWLHLANKMELAQI